MHDMYNSLFAVISCCVTDVPDGEKGGVISMRTSAMHKDMNADNVL